ncbi:MAG TPA: hypothetical protein VFE58_04870 [Tepidisphaeraceae bacterium]|nr:hypothetical protein [Tepidisphaeraceae bacterium]
MKTRYLVLFAAVSMVGFTVNARGEDAATQQPTAVTNNANDSSQQFQHADDVRKVLARVTDDAVKGDVKDVTDNFTAGSKDQFSRTRHKTSGQANESTGKTTTDTNGAVANGVLGEPSTYTYTDNTSKEQSDNKMAEDELKTTSKEFRDAWKAKYGHSFDIDKKNEPMVYAGPTFQILEGERGNNGAQTASARVGATTDQNGKAISGTQADLNKRMATVMVEESHGAPAVTLSVMNEGTLMNHWRVQPPAGMDYRTLTMNLNEHLQKCLAMKDQWPADENQAYMAVTHHILTAIAVPPGSRSASGEPADTNTAQPAGYNTAGQK